MTVYCDVTDLLVHFLKNSHVTGIQRGVFRILSEILSTVEDVRGLVRHPLYNKFVVVDLSFLKQGDCTASEFLSKFGICTGYSRFLATRMFRRRKPFKRLISRIVLSARWAASPELRREHQGGAHVKRCLSRLRLNSNDIVLSLGAVWQTDFVGIAELCKATGAKHVVSVYDIIQIRARGTLIDDKAANNFQKWFEFASENSDAMIAISNFTANEVREYWKECGIFPRTHLYVTQYPHEFVSTERKASSINIKDNYVLSVGSIDRRKNQSALVEAWKRLESEMGEQCPRLVLAGKQCIELGELSEKICMVETPSDADLEQLYKNCMFTIMPSLYEGWGLPVGESLWFGKPVLCSDASSLPEVGGSWARYFAPETPGSLDDGIRGMILDRPRLNVPRHALRTWADTAADVADVVRSLSRASQTSCATSPDFALAVAR